LLTSSQQKSNICLGINVLSAAGFRRSGHRCDLRRWHGALNLYPIAHAQRSQHGFPDRLQVVLSDLRRNDLPFILSRSSRWLATQVTMSANAQTDSTGSKNCNCGAELQCHFSAALESFC